MVGAGTKYWMPMDQYIGGIEHAILHLLYARFWTKVMRDMKLVAIDEPFTQLLTQGMVLNHVWARTSAQGGVDYFPPDEVTPVGEAEGRPSSGRLADGSAVEYRGMLKMGKTERNGVDPQDLIDRYGADTARLFVMFAAPPEQSLDWNNAGVEGANRFLKRLWKFAARHAETIDSAPGRQPARGGAPALRHEIHSVLRQVSYDYERMQYNTVVSGAMKLLNALEAHAGQGAVAPAPLREGFGILLRVLYPVCPHTTWTLWNELGFAADHGPLLDAPWPQIDESALAQDEIELMLQINGKLRGSIRVAAKADKAHIEAAALATPEFAKFAEGRHGEEGRRRSRPPGQRRRLMRRRLLLGAAVTLSGCGFAFKRAPELSFKTIQLAGFPTRSPLAAELRSQLEASPTTHVVESASEAQVVLQALSEAREKVVVAQTSANQIREFELRLRFTFRVRSAVGKDLIADERDRAAPLAHLHRERRARQGAGGGVPLPRDAERHRLAGAAPAGLGAARLTQPR